MNSSIIMLDSKDVAKILRCSVATARRIMQRRDFPLQRIGRTLLVEKNCFYSWLQQRHAV